MDANAAPLELVVSKDGPAIELDGKPAAAPPKEAPTAEALLKQTNEIGDLLRALIVSTKRLPREKGFEAHQEPVRSLALAQAHLQTGFMWLRRAIEAPKIF